VTWAVFSYLLHITVSSQSILLHEISLHSPSNQFNTFPGFGITDPAQTNPTHGRIQLMSALHWLTFHIKSFR